MTQTIASSSSKATVEKICKEKNDLFQQCFKEVKEVLAKARSDNPDSSDDIQRTYLHLAQELPKVLKKLPTSYVDPILWQV